MILIVMEGNSEEDRVLKTIRHIFFRERKEELLFCSFKGDNHGFFKSVKDHSKDGFEPDVFEIVKERLNSMDDHTLDDYESYQMEAIYIFFDYDPQNKGVDIEKLNAEIRDLEKLFNDPMENGQLFISYPMSEALLCINDATDAEFHDLKVSQETCNGFKGYCNRNFRFGKNKELLLYRYVNGEIRIDDSKTDMMHSNWKDVIRLNASKANAIVNAKNELPEDVDDVSQPKIFEEQSSLLTTSGIFYILSSYPMFLYEYFHGNGDF